MAWLLPLLSQVSAVALRAFYRVELAGEPVPPEGPVLVLANHPNSLVDPAAVSVAAGRPVRFLAKAPLFHDPKTSWLVGAAGAIPVHRRVDPGSRMEDNVAAFAAVHDALGNGDAVGLFPEGRSHSEPALAPLKTGAARIALGAASGRVGTSFPLVPVGLTYRRPDAFRSEVLVFVGPAVAWDDLAERGADDAAAVRELTERIDAALRRVTLNLEQREDRLAIETGEAVHAAEALRRRPAAQRITRLHEATTLLAELRRAAPDELARLLDPLERHGRLLRALDLRPEDLDRVPSRGAVARWIVRRALLLGIAGPVGLLGAAVFWLPRRATRWLADRPDFSLDVRATWKLLGGAALHAAWILALAGVGGVLGGLHVGLLVLLGLPLLAVAHQVTIDRLRAAWSEARRFMRLTGREELRLRLLETRRELAGEIERLRHLPARPGDAPLPRPPDDGPPLGR